MTDAQTIAQALGGIWRGNRGNAPCPVCQTERRRGQDALSLRDEGGRLLAYCHKRGCSFGEIARALDLPPGTFRLDAEAARAADLQRAKDEAKREGQAEAVWGDAETVAIHGTLAEAYLRYRGITCPLPDGAFYVFPDVTGAMAALGLDSCAEFCAALLKAEGLTLVPGRAFGLPGHLRLSFAYSEADLERGLDRLERFIASAQVSA